MTLAEDRNSHNLKFSELSNFDMEIRRFDVVMDLIQEHTPEDWEVWDCISGMRDAVFKLQNQMKGMKIEVFAAPWIEPFDEDDDLLYSSDVNAISSSPVDLFWEKKKADEKEEEVD